MVSDGELIGMGLMVGEGLLTRELMVGDGG